MQKPHWTEDIWVGFDTETTGIDVKTARILQFALLTDDPKETIRESYCIYVDPQVEIPKEASDVHGITREVLNQKAGFDPQAAIPWLLGWITGNAYRRKYPLVIYNAPYDWPLLLEECARIEEFNYKDQAWPLFLDPLVIDRKLDKYRKGSRKLEDTAKYYGVELTGAHDALQDVKASCGVLRKIVAKYPELKKYSIEDMQDLQASWYKGWRDQINLYWEQTGKEDRITGSWPI